jgi:hypothetical protein
MDYELNFKKLKKEILKIKKNLHTEILYHILVHYFLEEYQSNYGDLDPDGKEIKDLNDSEYKSLRIIIDFFEDFKYM